MFLNFCHRQPKTHISRNCNQGCWKRQSRPVLMRWLRRMCRQRIWARKISSNRHLKIKWSMMSTHHQVKDKGRLHRLIQDQVVMWLCILELEEKMKRSNSRNSWVNHVQSWSKSSKKTNRFNSSWTRSRSPNATQSSKNLHLSSPRKSWWCSAQSRWQPPLSERHVCMCSRRCPSPSVRWRTRSGLPSTMMIIFTSLLFTARLRIKCWGSYGLSRRSRRCARQPTIKFWLLARQSAPFVCTTWQTSNQLLKETF